MAVELGSVRLEHLTEVQVLEAARTVHHAVPGMQGDLVQLLGRPSVRVRVGGVFFGATAAEEVRRLREAHLGQRPLDFFADAVGEGYFAQVLVSRLEVSERPGEPGQLHYRCEVVEYVEPPPPVVADPLGALDAELAGEAGAYLDDVQDGIAAASELADLMTATPSFADPTTDLPKLLDSYTKAVGPLPGLLDTLHGLL